MKYDNMTCSALVHHLCMSLYVQDERDLTEEECAGVTAALSKAKIIRVKIEKWYLSTSGWIALSKGLSLNKEVMKVTLKDVPEELRKEMKQIIKSNPRITQLNI